MRTTPVYLDRLDHSLKGHGVRLKRAELLETASYALGFHNSAEFSAAAKTGDLTPPAPLPVARVDVEGETLLVLRDPASSALYALSETFVEQVVEEERRERFGVSPYGGLVDLSTLGLRPAEAFDAEAVVAEGPATAAGTLRLRFLVLDGDLEITSRHDDEENAKAACEMIDGEYVRTSENAIIDVDGRRALHYRSGWREVPAEGRDEREIVTAGCLAITLARLQRSREDHDQTLRLDVPDWRVWERDLKRASHKKELPISDELLHRFRHSVADVTCKSTPGEKDQVVWRQSRYVEKHLGGLLARLDRAEDALREAGIAPSDIKRRSKEDATEILAAIEAVKGRRAGDPIPGLYEVEATRDGDKCREIYRADRYDHWEDKGREIACKAFRMGDLEDFRDDEGGFDDFDSECDSFEVREVRMPEAAAIISDALSELSLAGDFRFGLPYSHPARIKLFAAIDAITPKEGSVD